MNIFIFEYLTGGGFINDKLPPSLVCEGAAMLLTLIKGLNPDFDVKILLDYRLAGYKEFFKNISPKIIKNTSDFNENFKDYINNSDYYLIIAPEFNNILRDLTLEAENSSAINLGCNSYSIEKTGNKFETFKKLFHLKKYLPATLKANHSNAKISEIYKFCKDLGYPVVFKPIDGVGGGGISLIRNKDEINPGIKKIKINSNENEFIIQEYIKGNDVSVSLFIDNNVIHPLTLNGQLITLGDITNETKYNGGYIPFNNRDFNHDDIFKIAIDCVSSITGLNGYVGIDFVIGEKPSIIEINPRLTTSYIGVRELLKSDLYTQKIIGTIIKPEIDTHKNVYFTRLELRNVHHRIIEKSEFNKLILSNLITPFFKFKDNYSGFILLKSKSFKKNLKKLTRIKNFILKNKIN
ncbi:MAG: ATP-grasp domain-containing protein [Candidatus Helarchaeota archaeon]